MATDIITRGLAINADAKAETANRRIDDLSRGIIYKGAVNYYKNLPNDAKLGDTYTVKYRGESGMETDGSEYVCSKENPIEWVELGPELAEVARTGNYNDLTNKLTGGTGIIINNNNSITYDEEEVSSVEYVDANITDTMNFIIQERDTERAARIAGDNLKQNKLTAGENISIEDDVISAAAGGQTIQYETMPTASADNLGKIVQYIGTTDTNYTNGYFYICELVNNVYVWNVKMVQREDFITIKMTTSDPQYSINNIDLLAIKKAAQQMINEGRLIPIIFVYSIAPSLYMGSLTRLLLTSVGTKTIRLDMNLIQPGISGNSNYLEFRQYATDLLITIDENHQITNITASSQWNARLKAIDPANTNYQWTPKNQWNIANKKYVDDSIASAITDALGGNY